MFYSDTFIHYNEKALIYIRNEHICQGSDIKFTFNIFILRNEQLALNLNEEIVHFYKVSISIAYFI